MPPPPSSIIKMTTGKPKICAYVQVSADLNTQIHRRNGIKKPLQGTPTKAHLATAPLRI